MFDDVKVIWLHTGVKQIVICGMRNKKKPKCLIR